jgi:hypothetical protein
MLLEASRLEAVLLGLPADVSGARDRCTGDVGSPPVTVGGPAIAATIASEPEGVEHGRDLPARAVSNPDGSQTDQDGAGLRPGARGSDQRPDPMPASASAT